METPLLLAKPTGEPPISLDAHEAHVRTEAMKLLVARPFCIEKYRRQVRPPSRPEGADLRGRVEMAAQWHDKGKAHPQWQGACQLDYQAWKASGRSAFFRAVNLQKANLRHEFDSVRRLDKAIGAAAPAAVRAAIAAHHGHLSRASEERWLNQDFKAYWDFFYQRSAAVKEQGFEAAVRARYEFAGPRALLRLADGRASAQEQGEEVAEWVPFSYHFPADWTRKPVQALAEKRGQDGHLLTLLRAPTGAGKTDAALLWARQHIEASRADRVVIAMPTRFTANALALSADAKISETGLYHSSALFQNEQFAGFDEKRWGRHVVEARALATPLTVTTLDHLCLCLTGTHEAHHVTFWHLAHSCVVIDEADFYDDFTQRNLVVLLRVLRLLAVPVLVMSATLPESARHLYALAGHSLPDIHEAEGASDLTRPRCRLVRLGAANAAESLSEPLLAQLRRALAGEATIIYANTIRRAQQYRQWFAAQGMADEHVILYHSRFTEPDKLQIERRLSALLGPTAWQTGKPRNVIAILTQIGELSVNISADLMISDICPVDRLAQRVGRLSRFQPPHGTSNPLGGELYVVDPVEIPNVRGKPTGEPTPYPAPYGHFDRQAKQWCDSESLNRSRTLLQERDTAYTAADFVRLVNIVYPALGIASTKSRLNAETLECYVVENWLLTPAHPQTVEAEETPHWQSRDIDTQCEVYADCRFGFDVEDDPAVFTSWMEFARWTALHRISIPMYEFKRAQAAGMLECYEVKVGFGQGRDELLYLVKKQFYSAKWGLRLQLDSAEYDDE